MQIDIQTRHFPLTNAMRNHVERRLGFALSTQDDNIQRLPSVESATSAKLLEQLSLLVLCQLKEERADALGSPTYDSPCASSPIIYSNVVD